MICRCGKPVFIKKRGLCAACYQRVRRANPDQFKPAPVNHAAAIEATRKFNERRLRAITVADMRVERMTLEAIGAALGVTRERARQIERWAIEQGIGKPKPKRHAPTPEEKFARRLERMEVRLMAKIEKHSSGCWLWTATTFGPRKYPHIRYPHCTGYDPLDSERSRYTTPYRLMFMLKRGPIPPGMTVDHICFNPLCCNPDHLQLLTRGQNAARKQQSTLDKYRAKRKIA